MPLPPDTPNKIVAYKPPPTTSPAGPSTTVPLRDPLVLDPEHVQMGKAYCARMKRGESLSKYVRSNTTFYQGRLLNSLILVKGETDVAFAK